VPSFRSFDDTKLSYDSEGSGPIVVLLHGYAMDVFSNWVRPGIVDRLKRTGFRVVALDQRGHGMSDKPHDPDAYGDRAMEKDVVALLDDLAADRVAMVGYSMGAMNTLRLLIAGEPRIAVAVLGGVGSGSIATRMRDEAFADAMETEDRASVTNPIFKSFRDYAETIRADRKALAALQRREVEEWGDPGVVDVPVLVLAAEGDPLIGDPAELAARMPKGEVAVVGGTHLNVVNNPQFHDAMLSFLEAQKGAL
jgi:non-heme chloroperoxidase